MKFARRVTTKNDFKSDRSHHRHRDSLQTALRRAEKKHETQNEENNIVVKKLFASNADERTYLRTTNSAKRKIYSAKIYSESCECKQR